MIKEKLIREAESYIESLEAYINGYSREELRNKCDEILEGRKV